MFRPKKVFNARKVKALMKKAKLNQADLSREFGVSEMFISKIINGEKQPSLAMAKELADLLGVTIDEIIK